MNRTPWWKLALIVMVVGVGIFYALPNIFGNDPGIQIRGTRGFDVSQETVQQVEQVLKNENIEYKRIVQQGDSIRVMLNSEESQLRGRQVIDQVLGDNYTSALSLMSAAPQWLQDSGAKPMYLGLDLRGGIHFLMEVDMVAAVETALESYLAETKNVLRKNRYYYSQLEIDSEKNIILKLRRQEQLTEAFNELENSIEDLNWQLDQESQSIRANLSQNQIIEIEKTALEQNVAALRSRIDQLGVAEPIVQRQGTNRIVLQLPGVQDSARAKEILGRAATLAIYLVDEENAITAQNATRAPLGSKFFEMRNGGRILLKNDLVYSGNNIVDARASLDTQGGTPIVSITLDAAGAAKNQRVTGDNVGNRMAVVYLETISEPKRDADGRPVLNQQGHPVIETRKIEEVLTAPVIRSQLGKQFQIEGIDSIEEAQDLALMLRAGALAAPVSIIEERTIGPSLGKANISQGFMSVVVGFVLVLIFMLIYYKVFGVAACLALSLNLVLMVAVLSILQATLTLPGVAGIVLTVGMAVDANVLIFQRIKEELSRGNGVQASIYQGYDKALSTILDANVTTLIAAVLLFIYGTGTIKGFAVTLSIGIVTSMFTAIILTRAIINQIYGDKKVEKLAI